jgi:diadenylate cyclase
MVLPALQGFFDYAIKFISIMSISDFFDIFIVAIAVYYFMIAIKGTRAIQLVKGVFIIIAAYLLSDIFRLNTLHYILSALVQVAMFGVIVIFQPELRSLLEKMGRVKIGRVLGIAFDAVGDAQGLESVINNITSAAIDMSETRTGALIVIERHTRLGEYMNSGTHINADVSKELLKNIFVPNTPLHDGAVIIRENKIITAGCVLPLTANTNLATELGTRHRAALGLSETSDAAIVVVSEETGKISIAMNGALTRNFTETSLKKALTKILTPPETEAQSAAKKKIFRKSK